MKCSIWYCKVMGSEKSERNSYGKHHRQKNPLSFQLSKFKSYFDASKKDLKFWWKRSTGMVLASWVQKAEGPGWIFFLRSDFVVFAQAGLHYSLYSVLQISLGKLQEWRGTDRRAVEFISEVWLKPQTNKQELTCDTCMSHGSWFSFCLVLCLLEASIEHLRCCQLFHFSIILNLLVKYLC